MKGMYLRTGKFGNFFYRDGHETMVSLMVTLFSEKMLISIYGFMSNLIKKSCKDSTMYLKLFIFHL